MASPIDLSDAVTPMLEVSSRIQVPLEEFEFTYVRSGGPGGQNVNKVNSKAVLRWNPRMSPSLPDDVRDRFLTKYASRLTSDSDLLITSQRYRDQGRNGEDCLEKLKEMILAVAVKPISRRATKPTAGSRRRRGEAKRQQAQKKQQRRPPSIEH